MEEYVKFELDAGNNGWKCSGCSLRVDCIGRPIFGKQVWVVSSSGVSWFENYPKFNYCPNCGKPVEKKVRYV